MAKKTPVPHLTPEQLADLGQVVQNAIANFGGQADDLEAALGMYAMGHYVGWKVLVLWHSKRTIRKYEDILGIKVREAFPPEGPLSAKSKAYQIAQSVSNFWKAVSGEDKSIEREDRKLIEG